MNKKTIAWIKDKFPALFFLVVRNYPIALLITELDRPRYLYCKIRNKPYFGTVGLAGQTWEQRKPFMRRLIINEIKTVKKDEFHVLEVGSWAGDSAVLWAQAMKSMGAKGKIICVDAWEPYLKEKKGERVNTGSLIMDRALRKKQIFNLFLHNIRTTENDSIVTALKGFSTQVLPTLKSESFDLIYLDADHSYSGIKRDLNLSQGLLRDGGILCGDDLDLQFDEVDQSYAHANKEFNMVIDPQTKRAYHPGVNLAVAEFFGQKVSNFEGFWAMRKMKNHWEQVLIPTH